ncbi:MAG: hypothetical protein IPK97_18560 [Ahniella sp.]|nr:hypothetical protein [Ahniella sp.]
MVISREFSATWIDPLHAGHGFNIEVVGSDSNRTVLVYWYTYDAQGKPAWVVANGTVQGEQAVLTAYTAEGGAPGSSFDPANVRLINWGTMTVSFTDCNNGVVRYTPVLPGLLAGQVPISRLTQLHNTSCSGGISGLTRDDSPGVEFSQLLTNTGVYPAGQGKAEFEERAERTEFKVELEDVSAGSYTIRVAGQSRGTLVAASTVNGIRGEVEYRSPVEPGKVLLDFDPRGQLVEIVQGSTIVFTGTLGTTGSTGGTGGTGGSGGDPGAGAPPFGNAVHVLSIEPQGNDGPELKAELEQRSDRVEFKVELEDLAAGSYTVHIDGTQRGTVQVVAVAGGTEGELEFRNPVEAGKVQLNFDPRGKSIQIKSGSNVVISGVFPATPNG